MERKLFSMRRVMCLLLVLAELLLCGTVGIGAFAADDGDAHTHGADYANVGGGTGSGVVAEGYCGAEGDNLRWELTESGELIISGSGKMADYTNTTGPWYPYREQITSVIIDEGVESIGVNAFLGCDLSVDIVIPDSVKSIGEYAFYNCEMTSVIIGDGVESIGDYAFYSCNSIVELVIGQSVSYIGVDAFYYCIALESVLFKNPVGWGYYYNLNDTKHKAISESDLMDTARAVETLKTYWRYYLKHLHSYTESSVMPTCTESGYTEYVCTDCGSSCRDAFVDPLGHEYDGSDDMECNRCFEWREAEHVHDFVEEIGQMPSCGYPGYMEYVCMSCGERYPGKELPPTGEHVYDGDEDSDCNFCGAIREVFIEHFHEFVEEFCEPTCSTPGYFKHICYGCGYIIEEFLKPIGHVYSNTTDIECDHCGDSRRDHEHEYASYTIAPTCDRSGCVVYYCDICGWTHTKQYRLPTFKHIYSGENDSNCDGCGRMREPGHEHSYTFVEGLYPTCREIGYAVFSCYDCGDTYHEQWGVQGDHSYDDAYDQNCNYCGEWREALHMHSYVAEIRYPTCNEAGFTEFVCYECGDRYQDNWVDPTYEHVYDSDDDPDCNFCGEWREVEHKHSYYEINRIEPGCHEPGRIIYNCECGDGYEEVWGDPVGHTYDNDEDAECNRCGEWRDINHKHYYTEYLVREATCVAGGVYKCVCHECGDYYVRNTEPTGEHIYDGDDDPDCNYCGECREVEHKHSYIDEIRYPTCNEAGFTEFVCYECGDRYQDNWVDPTYEHVYDSDEDPDCNYCGECREVEHKHSYYEINRIEPGCYESGRIIYNCECGDGYEEFWGDPVGHTYDNDEDADCNRCGECREVEHKHDYVGEVKEPSCVDRGYTFFTCASCGDWFRSDWTEPLGHEYDGELDADCNRCGEIREIEHKHNHVVEFYREPTCNEYGFTEFVCYECGDRYQDNWIEPTYEHVYDNDEDPDCNYCGECREVEHKHSYYEINRIEPGCHEPGRIIYNCECGDGYEEVWGDPVGHTYDNDEDAECNRCGEWRDINHKHYYTEYLVREATCVEGGVYKCVCHECGDYYVRNTEPTGEHIYDGDDDPDCNYCGECREVEHQHDFRVEKYIPTCTESGYMDYTCDICGYGYREILGEPLGHEYDGELDADCNRCGEIREVEHTHDYIIENVVLPTCSTMGYNEYVCMDCGDRYMDKFPATGKHIYSDDKDEYCDTCGEWREIENIIANGTCGVTTYWRLNDKGVLTLYGEGSTFYYTGKGMPWYSYRKQIVKVVVEEGIVSIGASSFYEFTNVTEIVLPEGLLAIGQYAFYGCSGVKVLNVPASVYYIGNYAFRKLGATGKIDIIFADPNGWYRGGEAMSSDYIADASAVTDDFRRQNYALNWNKVSEDVEVIARGTCGKKAEWKLDSNGTLSIGGEGKMSEFLTKGAPWFNFNGAIVTIVIEEGITSVGKCSFYGADNVISIKLPESLEVISSYAFYYCRNIPTVTVPANVISIKQFAFRQCKGLTSIVLDIKYGWSAGADSLTSTELSGESAVEYFTKANYSVDWERDVNAEDDSDPNRVAAGICGDGIKWELDINGTLTIKGNGPMANYNSTSEDLPWYKYRDQITKIVITDGVTAIGGYAFYNVFTKVETVEIASTVASIGKFAFYNCSGIRSMNIPASVMLIDEFALRKMGATGKTSLVFEAPSVWTCALRAVDSSLLSEPIAAGNAARSADYSGVWKRLDEPAYLLDGEKIIFGSYPQTEMTDSALISTLNSMAGALPSKANSRDWTAYGYYSDGIQGNYMWYKDIELDGERYRGVYYTSYRPTDPNDPASSNYSEQDDNGYVYKKVYWFKFEPIVWTWLTIEDGKALILCDLVMDCQFYAYSRDSEYDNNYANSYIRKWLNEDFYNTAFNDMQKEIIIQTTVDNSAGSTSNSNNSYACEDTYDNVFLLSHDEATEGKYALNTSNVRSRGASDYAKALGVNIEDSGTNAGNGTWWLRSPYSGNVGQASYVLASGTPFYADVEECSGVVPALWIIFS